MNRLLIKQYCHGFIIKFQNIEFIIKAYSQSSILCKQIQEFESFKRPCQQLTYTWYCLLVYKSFSFQQQWKIVILSTWYPIILRFNSNVIFPHSHFCFNCVSCFNCNIKFLFNWLLHTCRDIWPWIDPFLHHKTPFP